MIFYPVVCVQDRLQRRFVRNLMLAKNKWLVRHTVGIVNSS